MKIFLSSITFKILLLFLSWRVMLIIVMFFALHFVQLGSTDRFLGGGSINFYLSPELFSWANFDGEHYLSIAIFGYKGLEQAFFPVYPILISFFSRPFHYDLLTAFISSTIVGLIISNLAFLFSLILLWKLIRIDFDKKVAWLTLFVLLLYPTSFYFGALYSESLYLLISLISFYFARKGKWFLASVFGALSSATRIFGILLLPSLLIEAYQQKVKPSKAFWIFLIPLGLIIYMFYQYLTIEDPFAFYRLQKIVGEQHQSGLTLLPQVYFRYFKMVTTVDISNPIYQTIILEALTGVVFFVLSIIGYFKKIRPSYLLYAMTGFLTPTIQGSFSSVPRYVIVFFPSFLVLALILSKIPKMIRFLILLIMLVILVVETSLFLRGYWVA